MSDPAHPEPPEIARLRERIEDLDAGLVEQLAERARLVEELGRWKRGFGVPVECPDREAALRALHEGFAREHGLDPAFVARVFGVVLERSKERQREAQRSKRA